MRRPTPRALVLAGLVGLVLAASPIGAQESTTRGFTIGVHLSGASLAVENDDRNNAGGAGLHIGYGVNRRFTIFVQGDGAQFDDQSSGGIDGRWTMGHLELGTRFHFANSLRSWVPFLEAAVATRAVSVADAVFDGVPRDEVTLSGPGLTLGGGIAIYLSESFALDVQLLWTTGELTTLTVDNASISGFDLDARSSRFDIGAAWWP